MNIFLVLALAAIAAAQAGNSGRQQLASAAPGLATIVANLEKAQVENRVAARAYVVTRDYQLFKAGDNQPQSTVIAEVSFVPPGTKDFEIRHSSGSGQGEKVVRKVLDHEKEMARDTGEHDLSSQNYEFTYLGVRELNGARCYLLQLHPKRDDKNLVAGLAWIDAASFLPRRIAGTPSKSPSWWVKNLQLQMDYAPVAGMWLPVGSRAEADVRIVGKHTFVSRDVHYETSEAVADLNASRRTRSAHPRRPLPAAGAGVFIPE